MQTWRASVAAGRRDKDVALLVATLRDRGRSPAEHDEAIKALGRQGVRAVETADRPC